MFNRLWRYLRRFQPDDPSRVSRGLQMPRQRTAGVPVDPDSALRHAAVWSCIRIISETIASLPWQVHRRLPDGGRIVNPNHPADRLLHRRPNNEQTPFTWREVMLAHVLLYGNGYAEIERATNGQPLALWIIPPDRVDVERTENGDVVYIVKNRTQQEVAIAARDVFHLKGLGFDGIIGYPVVEYAARSIGLSIASETYGASFYGNGTHFGGFLKHPGKLQDEARQNLRQSLKDVHGGPEKAHRLGLLEEGMDFVPTTIPPDQAQFLDTRKFQVTEIARWFRVPPHKLADLERATFSNIEQQSIDFVAETITPWVVRLEQEANAKLIGQNDLFTRVKLTALLRGDSASRGQFYQLLLDRGIFSINDVLELEDRNPIGPDGDTRFVPLNMQPLERALEEPPPPPAPPHIAGEEPEGEEEENDSPQLQAASAHWKLIAEVLERQHRRMVRAQAEIKSPRKLESWLANHRGYVMEILSPCIRALAAHRGRHLSSERIDGLCYDHTCAMVDEAGYATPDFLRIARRIDDGILESSNGAEPARG